MDCGAAEVGGPTSFSLPHGRRVLGHGGGVLAHRVMHGYICRLAGQPGGAVMGLVTAIRRCASARGRYGWCMALVVTGAVLAGGHPARASLPARGMELVSHEDRNVGDVRRVPTASDSGDRVAYVATAAGPQA